DRAECLRAPWPRPPPPGVSYRGNVILNTSLPWATATANRRTMLTLYDYLPSGNGYKVRLLLSQLRLPFKLVEKDIQNGETRTPEFLAMNPNGRIPLLRLEDGRYLSESDAILFYFA